MNVSGRKASVFALQDWKDVRIHSNVDAWNAVRWHELASCGGWCDGSLWCKSSDTGEGEVKSVNDVFFQGKILRLEKRRAGGTPERDVGLGRSARSRRVRAAPGFTPSEEQLTRHCTGRRFRFVSLPPVSLVVRRHQCYS